MVQLKQILTFDQKKTDLDQKQQILTILTKKKPDLINGPTFAHFTEDLYVFSPLSLKNYCF